MLKAIVYLLVLVCGTANAQTWPTRSIQIVVPYAPGGVVDFIGRTLGQRLSQQVGQPVVIDNRPGAGGMIGVEYTARSAADGHTIVVMDPAVVINPVLQEKPLYDFFRDLATVAVIGSSPLVLTVNPTLPVSDVAQLVQYAKANPGKLNFASAGIGTTPHMAGEMLKARAGIDMARALQRRRPRDGGSRRRPGAGGFQQHHGGAALHQGWSPAGTRDHRCEALRCASRIADVD